MTSRGLDWHGTRRAVRTRVRQGVVIQLDGNPATVVDMSTIGAQVVSPTILKPNQRVRVSLATQRAYVADAEQVDPIIGTFEEGVVLDRDTETLAEVVLAEAPRDLFRLG